MTFEAASWSNDLLADLPSWQDCLENLVQDEAGVLAARGQWLGLNDPFCGALYAAVEQGVLGTEGLHFISLYDPSPESAGTSQATHAIRRAITSAVATTWCGTDLDAEGVRTRRDLESSLLWNAWHLGDGIAVRIAPPGQRSRWQLVHPARVRNPTGKSNSPTLRDGFVLLGGRVVGMWVHPSAYLSGYALVTAASQPTFVPWQAEDGTPNVIHLPGLRLPGSLRGVSELSPMIIILRQLAAVLESHVAGKRLQAIMSMFQEAEDDDAYKAAQANGTAFDPATMQINGSINAWIVPPGTKTTFTEVKFNGDDLDKYLQAIYRLLSATKQMPVDVVLCQMSNSTLANARAGLDQWDRTNRTNQAKHLAHVTRVMDQVAIRDAVAMGELAAPSMPWSSYLVGKHKRPPRYSTDKEKDQKTLALALENGVSPYTAYESILGLDWEDEQELRRAADEFLAAQGLDKPTPSATGTPAPPDPENKDGATPPAEDHAAAMQQATNFWRRLLFPKAAA